MLNLPLSAVILWTSLAGQPGASPSSAPHTSAEFQRRYQELAMQGQPAEGVNAMDLVGPVAERIKAVTAEVIAVQFKDENPDEVDLLALTRAEASPREREIALTVLQALMKSDVPKMTAELARAQRSEPARGDGLLIKQVMPQLGELRQIARFEAGRMTLAAEATDSREWIIAFDEAMRFGELAGHEPVLISMLVGVAVQSMAMDGAQRCIAMSPGDEMLSRMADVVMAHPLPGPDRAMRGEQLMAQDTFEYIYDTGIDGLKILQGRDEEAPPRPATPVVPEDGRLMAGKPTRAEERQILLRAFEEMRAWSLLSPSKRGPTDPFEKMAEQSLVFGMLMPAYSKAARAWDQVRAERAGLLTIIAIERFKLAKGAYPETLAELPADLLREPAMDPYSTELLRYLPPSKGPYEGGRNYLLYSVGPDFRDDGGRVDYQTPSSIFRTTGDYLLNRHAPVKKPAPHDHSSH